MIHRKFDKLKFTRTYIGGSKQRENEIFANVQGTEEDNSGVDWLEYRRIFSVYCDDVLNIILSWQHLLSWLTVGFGLLSLLVALINPYAGLFVFILSIGFNQVHRYLKRKEQKLLSTFDFSFDIILSAINQETGLNLSKN